MNSLNISSAPRSNQILMICTRLQHLNFITTLRMLQLIFSWKQNDLV